MLWENFKIGPLNCTISNFGSAGTEFRNISPTIVFAIQVPKNPNHAIGLKLVQSWACLILHRWMKWAPHTQHTRA